MKNVVLFGAGASHGSTGIFPESPPLGGQLYEGLRQRYPAEWGHDLPSNVVKQFERNGNDFESGMVELLSSDFQSFIRCMRSLGLYFASFAPDSTQSDVYSMFLTKLRERKLLDTTLFSTLNYECVLDYAACRVGKGILYEPRSPESLPSEVIRVQKLHGSCNFVMDLQGNTIENPQSVGVPSPNWLSYGGEPVPIPPTDLANYFDQNPNIFPIMHMYAPGKDVPFDMEKFFNGYQAHWSDSVRQARTAAIIGVRYHPSDSHIWKPLNETAARVIFVGSKNSFDEFAADRRAGPSLYVRREFVLAIDDITELLAV